MNRTVFEPAYFWEKTFSIRCFWYLVFPSETKYQNPENVPNIFESFMPLFIALIIFEALFCQFKGRFRLVDALVTFANWNLVKIADSFISTNFILVTYSYIFNHFRYNYHFLTYQWLRAFTLAWDSSLVWFLTFLLNDHNYYWEHRFLHESMIGWSAHQVHHSSQDFNLTIGIRQSLFQKLFSAPFYFPLALLGIPPSLFLTHLGPKSNRLNRIKLSLN